MGAPVPGPCREENTCHSHCTPVGPLSDVDMLVRGQVRVAAKAPGTLGAHKGPLADVHVQVAHHV